MSTLVIGSPPPELEALLERRRRAGADRHDEVWEGGVLHMNPPPSYEHERLLALLAHLLHPYADAAGLEITGGVGLGDQDGYRVPDLALHRRGASGQWQPTAALAIEVISPGDETWEKLTFYAAHDVDEILVADPAEETLVWLALRDGEYEPVQRSDLIDLAPAGLAELIGWA
ncbi:MAG: Uma2 family endonuclease [Solirubrobacteraceae bacterium]